MLSPDGQTGIVFNGAIYNFREIRRELESQGIGFRSQTDTEVLLQGYLNWGVARLLERVRGMFAFAIWDNTRGRLYLVRDRLGVKPLYYVLRNRQIGFASTCAAMAETGLCGDVDAAAIMQFLEHGSIPDHLGIYAGLHKLPAGAFLEWSGGEATVSTYWEPPTTPAFRGSFEDAVAETRTLLLSAVERRLFADVPVGALLSGGIDSSLVCWAVRQLGVDLTAFTVGVPADPADESADAAQTARELGIRHEILPLDGSRIPDVDELTCAYSEPFACSSALGLMSVSQLVKRSATVLLTGDGGDDVFLGYPRHQHLFAAQRLAQQLPCATTDIWKRLRRYMPKTGLFRRATHFIDYSAGGLPAVLASGRKLPYYWQQGIAGKRLTNAEPDRALWSVHKGRRALTDFLDYERRHQFSGEYMTKVDGATMRHALEARAPFLDQDLWEFAASLPYEIRLRNGELKAVLRELARREVGPRVAAKRKRGFDIPAGQWMLHGWRKHVDEVFRDSILAKDQWADGAALWKDWQRACASRKVPMQLWYLYVLELWLRSRRSCRSSSVACDSPVIVQEASL
jgi:asparagine synthase (glutamine-hydrolysing)